MKTFLMAATAMLWAMWAQAAITISGPEQCEVGETIVLQVRGVAFSELDGTSTITDIINEVRKVQVQHESELLGIELRMRIVPDGFQVTLEAEVTPTKAGNTFCIAIDRTDKEAVILPVAVHVIMVGPEVPPVPPIPPVPIPGKVNWVLLLSESEEVTSPVIATAMFRLEQYCKAGNLHQWHREDPSSERPWIKAIVAQAASKGIELPALIVGDCSAGDDAPKVLTIKPLAADPVAQLKGLGG